jgi:NADPH2:quinone reductase
MVYKAGAPKTMKAAIFEKSSGDLIVKEIEVPQPGQGEVLVKISAAPINPSDLAMIRKAGKDPKGDSFIPGIESSGVVVAAGKGFLPRLWLGKRVACSANHAGGGTWAEYMVTRAGSCFPLGKKVSDEQGSMSLVNPLTAIEFIEIARRNRHRAIINNAAASALGRMLELLAKKHGIPVINIVRSNKNVMLLKSQGSQYVLDSSDPSFLTDLESMAGDLNATVLFDSVISDQLGQMAGVLPRGSSLVIYGNLTLAEKISINPRSLIDNDIRISGFYLGAVSRKNGMVKNMLNILEVGRLMSSNMKIAVAGRFPLERTREAIDTYVNSMSAGKVLLIP